MIKPVVAKFARRSLIACLAFAFIFMMPVIAFASSQSDEDVVAHDARIDNYAEKVLMDGGSTALTWFLMVLLAALCVGVMFKSANRTHLD